MAQAKDRTRERVHAPLWALAKNERVADFLNYSEDVPTVESCGDGLPYVAGRFPNVVDLEALGGPVMREYLAPERLTRWRSEKESLPTAHAGPTIAAMTAYFFSALIGVSCLFSRY